jgi:hypothetical protein
MNKLLLAVAIVALAVGGSFVAWKLSDRGSRSQGALVAPSNTLTSPNGDFTLAVEDTGIVMKGPSSSVELSPGGLAVKSNGSLSLQGSAAISLQGAIVNLGCNAGGRPVARVGDMVNGGPAPNPILPPGSPTVLAC